MYVFMYICCYVSMTSFRPNITLFNNPPSYWTSTWFLNSVENPAVPLQVLFQALASLFATYTGRRCCGGEGRISGNTSSNHWFSGNMLVFRGVLFYKYVYIYNCIHIYNGPWIKNGTNHKQPWWVYHTRPRATKGNNDQLKIISNRNPRWQTEINNQQPCSTFQKRKPDRTSLHETSSQQ